MKRRQPVWRRRLLPACAVLLGLNLAALGAWTLPQGYKQRNAAARLKDARGDLEEARRSVERLRDRASAVEGNLADVERFYSRLGGTVADDLVPTLEAIEKMARSPGLQPGGRSIARSEVPATPVLQVSITLPLEGSYAQLVRFLEEVETSKRFLTIDSVSMRSAQQGAALQVQLSAYLRSPTGKTTPGRGTRARG